MDVDMRREFNFRGADMRAEFYKAMGRMLPTRETADFLARVIPLVTGERPKASTIRQHLVAPHHHKRKYRKRIHPPTW
jgi:hypothetical protein